MTIFGPIVSDDNVEDAVLRTLKFYLPYAFAEVERQNGLTPPYYERPAEASYVVKSKFDKLPDDLLPLVAITSAGTESVPVKKGNRYYVPWIISVSVVATSIDETSSRQYAYRLGAAVRASLAHNQSLYGAMGGIVRGVDWRGSANNQVPDPDGGDRTIWATRQIFGIDMGDVLEIGAGPILDPDGPGPHPDPDVEPEDWATIEDRESVTTTFERKKANYTLQEEGD